MPDTAAKCREEPLDDVGLHNNDDDVVRGREVDRDHVEAADEWQGCNGSAPLPAG